MKREERATLSVHIDTNAEVDSVGKRGESDDITKRLLACYHERCAGE
jgi:hypothetical protein